MPKQIRVLIVPVDGQPRLDAIDATPEAMRGAIGGGWLESTSGYRVDKGEWYAYCDEEAKLKELPVNRVATLLAVKAGWLHEEWLRGPVVFFGSNDDGDEIDVPEWVVEILGPFVVR